MLTMTNADGTRLIRVMLVDNQTLILDGFARIVDAQPDMSVIATATDGETAIRTAHQAKPDVILMDVRMPGLDGIQTTRVIIHDMPETRIIGLTSYDTDAYAIAMLDAGASGFVVKDAPAEQLAEAIRKVAGGANAVDPGLAAEALVAGINPLTERERDILRIALSGASVKHIAGELYLSPGTVRNHLSSAIGKTGAGNRAQAVRIAQDKGWV